MATNDTRTASLVLVAGAVGVGYWWYHLTQGKVAGEGAAETPTPSSGGAGGGAQALPKSTVRLGSRLPDLERFAAAWGLKITSGLRPGDTHSPHSEGRAIDVALPARRALEAVKRAAAALGIHVLVEDYGPGGGPYRSTGPHLHLSYPETRNGREVF
jgi:hypothetical protein